VRILVLTFYYPPDLSAGAFRSSALVEALREVAPPGTQTDVVTTRPNRYHSYTAEAPAEEAAPGLTVTRVPLPPHRSGTADQSRAFAAFAGGVRRLTQGQHYDVVFATSSRLMTAALGAAVARRVGARLYLDIRDIFVDTIKDVFSGTTARVAGPVFDRIERWAVAQASRVNLVSEGFGGYFRARYPRQRFTFLPNGVDDEFVEAAPNRAAPRGSAGPVTVLYAGNLGEGQGLHAVVPGLAAALGARVRFRIIGDGGQRTALESAVLRAGVANVELQPPVGRAALLDAYRAADVLFLHLNDYDAFRKVLPSKLFEYAALGLPVWAGVAGYAARFVEAEVANAAVFPPCDVAAGVRAFETLELGVRPRDSFVAKFGRRALSRALAAEVLAVGAGADHPPRSGERG
jgi:glycosyltransferase involved in cell wall biosynthesis